MTSDHSPDIEVDYRQWSGFFQELGTESDRGVTILASVWIENLLERKLRSLFKEGSSAARRKLFELNGPFSSFSSKILAAYSLGWINSDTFHDINLIRKIRNQFAHDLHGLDLESAKIRKLIDEFRVPARHYSDWFELQAVASSDGKAAILYTGEPPDDAGEPLNIQRLRYQCIVSLLVAEVAVSLNLSVRVQRSEIPNT